MDLVVALVNLDYRSTAYVKWFLMTAPVIVVLFVLIYVVTCYGPRARTLRVSGVVLEGDTDKPVPNAKVIVTVWNRGFLESSPTQFMMLTDTVGKFSIKRSFPFLIREMSIVVCSPDNHLAGLNSTAQPFEPIRPLRKGVRKYWSFPPGKGHFTMRVYPPAVHAASETRNQYETFSSGWVGEPEHVPSHSVEPSE
jgi:hypothetical protein